MSGFGYGVWLRLGLGRNPEHAFFEHIDVLQQRGRTELEVVAVENVEAGEAAEFVFERAGGLVFVGNGQHFDALGVAPAVLAVFPDDFVHLGQGLLRDCGGVLLGLGLLFVLGLGVVPAFGLGSVCVAVGLLGGLGRRKVNGEVRDTGARAAAAEGLAVEEELTERLGLELLFGVRRAVEDDCEAEPRERRVLEVREVLLAFDEFVELRRELQQDDVADERAQGGVGLLRPQEPNLERRRLARFPDRDVEPARPLRPASRYSCL